MGKTTGAYIAESVETGDMILHLPPATATWEVIALDDVEQHNSPHKRRRRARRRRLTSPNPGTLTVLVLKVIDSLGVTVPATNTQLVSDIFEDQYCLKTPSSDHLAVHGLPIPGTSKGHHC